MRMTVRESIGWLAVCVCLAAWAWAEDGGPADIIVTNARVYTVNSRQEWAEAVAIRQERILAVGSRADIEKYRKPTTKVMDAGGRLVLPGFTDSHIHFMDGSLSMARVNLDDAVDLKEIQRRVKAYADAHPELPWVLGRGWVYSSLGASTLPDKKDLDAIIPDRPVYLTCYDGHTWWGNSKALQMAGVTKDTPNPPGGQFVKDPKTGEPTGAILEDAADDQFERVIPDPSRAERMAALRLGLKEANRLGLVRVHGAAGVGVHDDDLRNADLYEELRKNGELTVRFYMAYRINPPRLTEEQIASVENARAKYHDEWMSAGAVKFFLDGVVEPHTAAMLEPYSDDPKLSGSTFWDPAEYQKAVLAFDQRGIQMFSHAVGDRAVRLALDSYENAAKTNGTKDARHRIEHIETIAASDIPRFGKLGVIASMQPLHAEPNDDTLLVWLKNVGPERAQRAWPWRSILKSGGVLAFGSDWPIVTQNPWVGIQNALTRQTAEGKPEGGWVPSERIHLEDAIRAYTLGAAFAGHREASEGSLEAGKLADLIVLSQDLFEIEPSEIGKTQVLMTMVGGKVVYESPEWTAAQAAAEKK